MSDYAKMTIKELRDECKARAIKGYSRASKSELCHMLEFGDHVTRSTAYLRANDLATRWALLDEGMHKYAAYLVRTYAYPVQIAIQRAYIFGFDKWPYDYRAKRPVRETASREDFGI